MSMVQSPSNRASRGVCAVAKEPAAFVAFFGLERACRDCSSVRAFGAGEEVLNTVAVLVVVGMRAAPHWYDVVCRTCWRSP